jgi:hypothetical protein
MYWLLNEHRIKQTTLSTRAGSEQREWLLADLRAVRRSITPWVVLGGHRPMYICSTFNAPDIGDGPVAQDLRASLEEELLEHGVRRVVCSGSTAAVVVVLFGGAAGGVLAIVVQQ